MFVIKNTSTGRFIDMDFSKEGYPYETSLTEAMKWIKLDGAKEYLSLFESVNKSWVIEELIMETRPLQTS